MKSMKKLLCTAMVLGMLLCMTACSSSIAGRYEFDSMEAAGETITADDLAALGSDEEFYLELKSDGTGTLVAFGETNEMGWADGKIWPASDPDDTANYTYSNGTLTLEQDGMKLVFKK